MQNKYQRLAGNTVKLGLGTFGSKVLVFLMVRFYTEYLSPADYGTADLITQAANLLIPLLSLGITDAVFRFVIDEAEGAAGIFTTGFFVLLAGSVLAGLLALCGSAELDSAWLIAAFLIASNFHTLPAQFVRAKGEMTCFAVQGLLNTALVIGLNILFLAVFRLGVTGYVLSTVAADVLTTAYLVLRARLWRWLKRPAKGTLGRMLRYCVPLIPTATFWWITSVSGRYMITAWLGSAANGVYAVAAKLPTILTVRSSVFMEAWRFSAVTEQQEGTEAHLQFYASVWRTFIAGMVLSASGVITFSQLAVRLLAEEEFFAAWQFVPVLCLAMVFAAFSTFFSSVYVVSKKEHALVLDGAAPREHRRRRHPLRGCAGLDAGLHFPLRRGGHHGDGPAGDLRLDDPAHRGRLSACDPGGQDVPEPGLFGVSRPLRAGARRARGHRPFHPCHPRCAPQIPQPDGLVHPRPDGRFALRDRHGLRRPDGAAGGIAGLHLYMDAPQEPLRCLSSANKKAAPT